VTCLSVSCVLSNKGYRPTFKKETSFSFLKILKCANQWTTRPRENYNTIQPQEFCYKIFVTLTCPHAHFIMHKKIWHAWTMTGFGLIWISFKHNSFLTNKYWITIVLIFCTSLVEIKGQVQNQYFFQNYKNIFYFQFVMQTNCLFAK
jgi:Na+-transporting NADH:ubiquinone oxidoreductase subunit NqrD